MANDTLPTVHVLIPAAGVGARMGGDVPKQYRDINGKALLRHTIDNALSWADIGADNVHVIIHPDHRGYYDAATAGLNLPQAIFGAHTRSSSVFNGLKALRDLRNIKEDDIVLIHDGARPFTHKDDVTALMEKLHESLAATLCNNIYDTIRIVDSGDNTNNLIDRDTLRALQTPQGFRFGDILRAHENNTKNVTDDTALLTARGIDVALVTAAHMNTKITTPQDFTIAKNILTTNNFTSPHPATTKAHALKSSHPSPRRGEVRWGESLRALLPCFKKPSPDIRTGFGFDVHAFEPTPSDRTLVLCGVHVPHDLALSGHSDADVGLHALTDALLGACGAGDIGRHFPPSDDAFKDMDSAVFLQKSMQICAAMGGRILNADITLICEAPKITPHAQPMCARIAALLGVEQSRINVKATTSERLGFTGRGEGIAAQAVVSVLF